MWEFRYALEDMSDCSTAWKGGDKLILEPRLLLAPTKGPDPQSKCTTCYGGYYLCGPIPYCGICYGGYEDVP